MTNSYPGLRVYKKLLKYVMPHTSCQALSRKNYMTYLEHESEDI